GGGGGVWIGDGVAGGVWADSGGKSAGVSEGVGGAGEAGGGDKGAGAGVARRGGGRGTDRCGRGAAPATGGARGGACGSWVQLSRAWPDVDQIQLSTEKPDVRLQEGAAERVGLVEVVVVAGVVFEVVDGVAHLGRRLEDVEVVTIAEHLPASAHHAI